MTQPPRIHLFQGYGIELEYMLVDRDTLKIKPITDELLKHELGEYGSDFENGIVTWSNELVLHVVELKSTKPESGFSGTRNKIFRKCKKHQFHFVKMECDAHAYGRSSIHGSNEGNKNLAP